MDEGVTDTIELSEFKNEKIKTKTPQKKHKHIYSIFTTTRHITMGDKISFFIITFFFETSTSA